MSKPRRKSPHSPEGTTYHEVGYGRPPRHGQFKPGHSGNPKGRPKNSRNLKTIIREVFTERIMVREGERRRSITKLEGVVLRQVEAALKGSDRAALAVLKMAQQVELLDDFQKPSEMLRLSPAEQSVFEEIRASLLEGNQDDGKTS